MALVEMADRWSDAVDEAREVEAENEMDAATMRRTIGKLRGTVARIDHDFKAWQQEYVNQLDARLKQLWPQAAEFELDTIDGV